MENTLPAFATALAQGAGGIESDAWLAADGAPVLVHDRSVERGGRRLRVTSRTSADLARVEVPSLAALYAGLGSDYELSLDLEHPAVALPVLRVAQAASAEHRLWACHHQPAVLGRLRPASEAVRLVCSPDAGSGRHWLRRLLDRLVQSDIDALNMRWQSWDRERVSRVRDAGLLAFGWDAHRPDGMRRLADLGVDAIYTDHVDRLRALLARG